MAYVIITSLSRNFTSWVEVIKQTSVKQFFIALRKNHLNAEQWNFQKTMIDKTNEFRQKNTCSNLGETLILMLPNLAPISHQLFRPPTLRLTLAVTIKTILANLSKFYQNWYITTIPSHSFFHNNQLKTILIQVKTTE